MLFILGSATAKDHGSFSSMEYTSSTNKLISDIQPHFMQIRINIKTTHFLIFAVWCVAVDMMILDPFDYYQSQINLDSNLEYVRDADIYNIHR